MSQELIVIEEGKELSFFEEGGADHSLSIVKKHLEGFVPDIKTSLGRKTIASMSSKIGKSRKLLDDLGKTIRKGTLTEEKRRKIIFDEFQAEFRKPLTDWEVEDEKQKTAEKERIESIAIKIRHIAAYSVTVDANGKQLTSEQLRAKSTDLFDNVIIKEDEYQEFYDGALEAHSTALDELDIAIEHRDKYEAEQEELETLRKDKLNREKAAAALRKAGFIEDAAKKPNTADTATDEKPVEVIAEKEEERPAREKAPSSTLKPSDLKDVAEAQERAAQVTEPVAEPTVEEKKAINKAIHQRIVDLTGLSHDDSKALLVDIIKGKIDHLQIVY